MKQPNPALESLPVCRAYYHYTSPDLPGYVDLEVVSSYGHHMLWTDVTRSADGPWSHRLKFLRLFDASGEDGGGAAGPVPPEGLVELDIPLPIESVLHYDFCDEWASLAVVVLESSGSHTIHLFEY